MLSVPLSTSLAVAVGLSALACAAPPASSLEVSRAAIAGGEPSPPSENAVVKLESFQPGRGTTTCAGALVAPSLVLTAEHCVAFNAAGPESDHVCEVDGSVGPNDDGAGWLGEPLSPADVHVFFGDDLHLRLAADGSGPVPDAVGVHVFGSGTTEACIDDIALVALDRAFPVAGLPLRLERDVAVGERLTVVGYGFSDVPTRADRYRRSGVSVLAVGPDDTSRGLGSVTPRTFLTDAGPCAGDEGGPALSEETGAAVGIYSHALQGGDCTAPDQGHAYTKVAPYANLIRAAFQATGVSPIEERASARAQQRTSRGCSVGGLHAGAAQHGTLWGVLTCSSLAIVLSRRRRKKV